MKKCCPVNLCCSIPREVVPPPLTPRYEALKKRCCMTSALARNQDAYTSFFNTRLKPFWAPAL